MSNSTVTAYATGTATLNVAKTLVLAESVELEPKCIQWILRCQNQSKLDQNCNVTK
jgi:hypothetical protein